MPPRMMKLWKQGGLRGCRREIQVFYVILQHMIFDGEHLSDLMAPQGLGWKARTKAELVLMEELAPLLHKRAHEREISGLSAYEENH